MKANKLLANLRSRGISVTVAENASHILVSPKQRLSTADRHNIIRSKPQLLSLLSKNSAGIREKSQQRRARRRVRAGSDFEVRFSLGNMQVVARRYHPPDGRVFAGRFALDCETDVVDGTRVPDLALVVVSDGNAHFFMHPDDLGAFVLAHRHNHLVFHNVAFDFWVVLSHLWKQQAVAAVTAWNELAKRGHLHDTMLLDRLVRTAEEDGESEHIGQRDLAEVAAEYTHLRLNKQDPYRLRFGELIGADWAQVDRGFFRYAVPDAIATARAYRVLRQRALGIMKSAGFTADASACFSIDPQAVQNFGLLTEKIQVGAAIALAQISRTGIHTDHTRLMRTEKKHRRSLNKLIRQLDSRYPDLFHHDRQGNLVRTSKSGAPSKSLKALETYLLGAAAEINKRTGRDIVIPRTPTGLVSRSISLWSGLSTQSRFLRLWIQYENAAKLCQFLRQFEPEIIRPKYGLLARTGRTTCSSPNLQQIPRLDDFREILVASPGRLLLTVDYKYIELVALAAACACRFGRSHLAEIIAAGTDPHCYTAAMLLHMSYDEFCALKRTDPGRYKDCRQRAKPVNFGVPGGMGAAALVEYARSAYMVEMTLDEAENLRTRLVEDIYPELALYLADNSLEILARNLETTPADLSQALSRFSSALAIVLGSVRKVVGGYPYKADGEPYSARFVTDIWDTLHECNHNPAVRHALLQRQGSPELEKRLFFAAVPTLTGRVRGGVKYTAERNTQFQGLAADGAKLALANLVLRGYRVVGFVHDEVLIELRDRGGYVLRSEVEKVVGIIRASMEQVTFGVPVECEYTLSTRWSKRAELISEGKRVVAWSPPHD